MFRPDKEKLVDKMKADFARSQAVLFLDFTGLTVAEERQFRRKIRETGGGYQVVKNSLMRRVLTGTAAEGATSWLKGSPTSIVLGFTDPVAVARTTYEFLKSCEHLKVKGSLLDKKPLTAVETEAFSKLPSRREMQAQILALIMSPASNLLRLLKGPAGRIVGAVDAKAKQGESST